MKGLLARLEDKDKYPYNENQVKSLVFLVMRRMINLLWVVVHIFTERCPLLGALGCVSRLCGEEGVGAHPCDGGDQEPGEGEQRGGEHDGGIGTTPGQSAQFRVLVKELILYSMP